MLLAIALCMDVVYGALLQQMHLRHTSQTVMATSCQHKISN